VVGLTLTFKQGYGNTLSGGGLKKKKGETKGRGEKTDLKGEEKGSNDLRGEKGARRGERVGLRKSPRRVQGNKGHRQKEGPGIEQLSWWMQGGDKRGRRPFITPHRKQGKEGRRGGEPNPGYYRQDERLRAGWNPSRRGRKERGYQVKKGRHFLNLLASEER